MLAVRKLGSAHGRLAGRTRKKIGGDRRRGLIGSHTVDALTREDVGEIVVYDNFSRGTLENLAEALRDDRGVASSSSAATSRQTDILDAALEGRRRRLPLRRALAAALPRVPALGVRRERRGTFNVLEACVRERRRAARLLLLGLGLRRRGRGADDRGPPVQQPQLLRRHQDRRRGDGPRLHHRYGLRYVGLRYMNVYGPRQDYRGAYIAVIMKMLDAIDRGEPLVVYGDGSQAYDFVYVERLRRRQRLRDEGRTSSTASTTSAPAIARRSRSWPSCSSRSPARTSASTTSPPA